MALTRPGGGAKQHCICTTIGARVVPTRSSSIRGDQFIKTVQAALAFAGAAAWDKPRSKYGVPLHPLGGRDLDFSFSFLADHPDLRRWIGGGAKEQPAFLSRIK